MKMKNQYIVFSLLLVLSFFLLGFYSAKEPARMDEAAFQYKGKALSRGALLYGENCKSCHGIKGEGVGQLGPALNDQQFFQARLAEVGWSSTLESYIQSTVDHGRLIGTRSFYAGNGSTSVMAAWHLDYGGPLRSDQIADLTAFVMNWEATALGRVVFEELVVEDLFVQTESSAEGRQVFRQNCLQCHSFHDLKSEGAAPDLSTIKDVAGTRMPDQDAETYIKDSVLVPDRFVPEGFENRKEGQRCGAILSEKDLQIVADFVLN